MGADAEGDAPETSNRRRGRDADEENAGAGAKRERGEDNATEGAEATVSPSKKLAAASPSSPTRGAYATRESHLRKQERDGELKWKVIKNDGSEESSRLLIALKNIFGKQLPNMPKEYIVRLVFDSRHNSMLCMKNGNVIGGITYRPFPKQRMGEIAFCAVSANEQVKGYGTRLMNHIKEYAKDTENMTHLITFADNNAVGYFEKQGFTKEIMMEREKWNGYIKEYDGGTIMECQLDGHISYVDFVNQIREQRKVVEAKVREMSTAHKVYPGLKDHFNPKTEDGKYTPIDVKHIKIIQAHADVWPFAGPVNPMEVPDYYEIVKDPLDLELIKDRVSSENYYTSLEMFCADFRLMFHNCRLYNSRDTVYFKCANRLEAFFDSKIAAGVNWKVREPPTKR